MFKKKEMHVVWQDPPCSESVVVAVFSSKKKALDFIEKFQNSYSGELEIETLVLDQGEPGYVDMRYRYYAP